jgi:prevent-host-death family protein
MSISLTEDVKTVADLERNPRALVEQARETGRPIVIAEAGKPSVVLIDAAAYEHIVKSLNLARLLAEGEADVRAGRVRPASEFLKELRDAKKVSR